MNICQQVEQQLLRRHSLALQPLQHTADQYIPFVLCKVSLFSIKAVAAYFQSILIISELFKPARYEEMYSLYDNNHENAIYQELSRSQLRLRRI